MKYTKIGFTGSREGMNNIQRWLLASTMRKLKSFGNILEAHHGDCLGSDLEFHNFIALEYPKIKIVVHPPRVPSCRAFCEGHSILEERDYQNRNQDIVKCSKLLIATPKNNFKDYSGTWATISYAAKRTIPVLLLFRDGQVNLSNL